MSAQPETAQDSQTALDYTSLRVKTFWVKLITGAIFGALSYFIFRFYVQVTFFVVIPALYLVTYLIILIALFLKNNKKLPKDIKPMLRFPLNFTSTWFMAFFVFGIICYYFGW